MVRAHVIGGGLAGLVAAFELRDRGFATTLYESHGWLGGRAFSPKASIGGADDPERFRLDNGPHVMLGCYDRTIALCERLGTAETGFVKQRALRVDYRDARGEASTLKLLPAVPAPLAFPPAVLTHAGFSLRARARALLGFGGVLLGAPSSWSFDDWLGRWLQRGRPDAWVWRPMCRAIMNAEPDRVSASLFLATLRRAFLGSARRAGVWLPDRPWSELIGEPAIAALEKAGVEVRLRSAVTGFEREGAAMRSFRVGVGDDARHVAVPPGDLVVSAMPWHALAKLVEHPALERAARIPGSPITSAWFELDAGRLGAEPFVAPPLTALVGGGPFHFLCRRPSDPPWRLALLNGGGAGLEEGSVPDWIDAGRRQLRACFPELGSAVEHAEARVTREQSATIVAAPGRESDRPEPGLLDGFSNLLVCGDWTATGLPSTLEGAAESGMRAVRSTAR